MLFGVENRQLRLKTTNSYYRVAITKAIFTLPNQQIYDVKVGGVGIVQVADGSYFKVTQYPSPSTGQVTRFWMTGSNSNLLFARRGEAANVIGLNDVWGQKQLDIANSGFDPIIYDFEPEVGDEIRFNGTELQTYTITQISQSVTKSLSSTEYNALTLVLDKQLPNSINPDFFLLRRYVTEPGNIIIDYAKPPGATGEGIVIPEFLGEKANETKNKVLSILRNP